ncbi:type II toxin-antitoxin system PemI/MazE family antitoxin [Schleiferilactobacillus shenzhenensis]|nr:AbrB family transcriptional regulator [Schleiferilactobacillus shenzhenensis]
MVVKTRRQGNSIMITVPASFGIGENVEFEPVRDNNGVISFIPVRKNIFAQHPEQDFRAALLDLGVSDQGDLMGHENVWN